MEAQAPESLGDREFFRLRIFPLLNLKAHKALRGRLKYAAAIGKPDIYDELLINVATGSRGASPGWTGFSPAALRLSNADSPDNILSEMTRISKGITPTCAVEYMLSGMEQYRIKLGIRPQTQGLIRASEQKFEADHPKGPTHLAMEDFARTSTEEAERKRLAQFGSRFAHIIADDERKKLDGTGLVGLDGKPLFSDPSHGLEQVTGDAPSGYGLDDEECTEEDED